MRDLQVPDKNPPYVESQARSASTTLAGFLPVGTQYGSLSAHDSLGQDAHEHLSEDVDGPVDPPADGLSPSDPNPLPPVIVTKSIPLQSNVVKGVVQTESQTSTPLPHSRPSTIDILSGPGALTSQPSPLNQIDCTKYKCVSDTYQASTDPINTTSSRFVPLGSTPEDEDETDINRSDLINEIMPGEMSSIHSGAGGVQRTGQRSKKFNPRQPCSKDHPLVSNQRPRNTTRVTGPRQPTPLEPNLQLLNQAITNRDRSVPVSDQLPPSDVHNVNSGDSPLSDLSPVSGKSKIGTESAHAKHHLNPKRTTNPYDTPHPKLFFRTSTAKSTSALHARGNFWLKKSPSIKRAQSFSCNSLLGSMEETILRGRVEPVQTVENFRLTFGACGTLEDGRFFCPDHKSISTCAMYYSFDSQASLQMSSTYMTCVDLGPKGYEVPRKGQVQVTLFNPHGTVVKMFLVAFDLTDMPPNCETFLRQRVYYMPQDASSNHPHLRKWLRFLIHLRFRSSKRKDKIYIYSDCRILVFCKNDAEVYLDQISDHNGKCEDSNSAFSSKSTLSQPVEPSHSVERSLSTYSQSPGRSDCSRKHSRPDSPASLAFVSAFPLPRPSDPPVNTKTWVMKSFTEHPTDPRYSPR